MKLMANKYVWQSSLLVLSSGCISESLLVACETPDDCDNGLICGRYKVCVEGASPREPPPDASSPSPSPAREITISPSSPRCSGKPFTVQLSLSEADGDDYQWTFETELGLEASETEATGSTVELEITAERSGEYLLKVAVEGGSQSVEQPIELKVQETPRIEVENWLPNVCPNELLDVPLDQFARGGNAAGYQWTVQTKFPEGDVKDMGMPFDGGNALRGRFTTPSPNLRQTITVELGLTDGECSAEPVPVVLDQIAQAAEDCPQVVVTPIEGSSNSGVRHQLPPLCRGSEFSVDLGARTGWTSTPGFWSEMPGDSSAEFSWEVVGQEPPGLSFDSATRTLHGVPEGSGTLVVKVTEQNKSAARPIEAHLDVEVRDNCWFAYVAGAEGQRRLELFDAHLRDQASARRSFPTEPLEASVEDFKFSAHGNFVAYRLRDPNGDSSLRILDMHTLQDVPVSRFAGDVSEYAWSPSGSEDRDANLLAVAFSEGEGAGQLGGVSLSAVVSETITLEEAFSELRSEGTYLDPAPVQVESKLTWYDADRLAFAAPFSVDGYSGQLAQARVRDGEEIVVTNRSPFFGTTVQVIPGTNGYFGLVPRSTEINPELNFYPNADGSVRSHSPQSIVSPAGTWVGRARDGNLHLFAPESPSFSNEAPDRSSRGGCSSLLAWATDGAKIACVDTAGDTERIVLFDVTTGTNATSIERSSPLGDYDYSLDQGVGMQRVFSPSGDWFLFRTYSNSYAVSLNFNTSTVTRLPAAQSALGVSNGFTFSPDERFATVQSGTTVQILDIVAGGLFMGEVQVSPTASEACSEGLFDGSVPWCGSTVQEPIEWSSDSKMLAYVDSEGSLYLKDMQPQSAGTPFRVDESCPGQCVVLGMHHFQKN